MSGIYFFNTDDFHIKQTERGDIMHLRESKGLALLLFYSKECKFCDGLINKFKQLPNLINGCIFGMINVNKNIGLVELSKNTINPLTYVPDLILYVDGAPHVRYDGNHEIEDIRKFIFDIYKNIEKTRFLQKEEYRRMANAAGVTNTQHPSQHLSQNDGRNQQQQHQQQQVNRPPENEFEKKRPDYCIGQPLCGPRNNQNVCYLDFSRAYAKA